MRGHPSPLRVDRKEGSGTNPAPQPAHEGSAELGPDGIRAHHRYEFLKGEGFELFIPSNEADDILPALHATRLSTCHTGSERVSDWAPPATFFHRWVCCLPVRRMAHACTPPQK